MKNLSGKEFQPKSIVILRPDRLGDVLVTLPAIRAVSRMFPSSKIFIGVTRLVRPFVANSYRNFEWFDLETETPEADLLIAFFDQSSISRRFRHIPLRLGPRRWLRSYFFWNLGRRLKSKKQFLHEAERALELLRPLGLEEKSLSPPVLEAPEWLADPVDILLHPGMGGSALNLHPEEWEKLYRRLKKEGFHVLISIGPLDTHFLSFFPKEDVYIFKDAESCMAVFKASRVVVAPSTGPLHLAAALGCWVYGIFSPTLAQRVERWGPLTDKKLVWQPTVDCKAKSHCLGFSCGFYPCMRQFQAEKVLWDLEQLFLTKGWRKALNLRL